MLLEICGAGKDHNKLMPEEIDVAIHILKANPTQKNWCTFANTPAFDRHSFELKSDKVIFDLYYLKSLSGTLESDQFKKSLTEDVEEELAAVVARIIKDSCSDVNNNTHIFWWKDIPRPETWKPRYFVFPTNPSEDLASEANHLGVHIMCTPPCSFK